MSREERDTRAAVPEKAGRTRLYDLAEARIGPTSYAGENPAVKAFREQTEILSQENSDLTLKQLVDEKRKPTSTGVVPAAAAAPMFQLTPDMVQVLAGMPEDQRDKLMASVMLMGARGTGGDAMAYLWPIMAMQMKSSLNASTASSR